MTELGELRFPPNSGQAILRRAVHGFAFVLLLAIAGFLSWLLVQELHSQPPGGVRWNALAFYAIGIFMAVGLSFVISQIHTFSVQSGLMRLPSPIRLKSGQRSRSVPLNAIAQAERVRNAEGGSGVTFTMSDGTQFALADGDLPEGGAEFLDRLCKILGRTDEQ